MIIEMQKRLFILLAIAMELLTGCEGTNWRSSVPSYPIHLEFNTDVGMYVSFVPENLMGYIIADARGIHYNGITYPLTVEEAYGYAGTVVYIDGMHPYGAYDLCCPHCLLRNKPCTVNGMYAVCPVCYEEYDIYSGNGAPRKGISREPLKEYSAKYINHKVVVTAKQ
ncbi:MAG: hypothetical protein J6W89_02575 [Paludibacteraceae bacterium]|nr:hypothetical protein [Paludibacteraceae bacterium]